jgi:hypothetical protein
MEEKSAVFFTDFLTNWANSDTTPCGATQRDRKTQELSDGSGPPVAQRGKP